MTKWVGACVLNGCAPVLGVMAIAVAPMDVFAAGVDVSQSGSPNFSYPVDLPIGPNGLRPQVTLAYTGAGNGVLGQGWSLQATSMISRCPTSYLIDGKSFPIWRQPSDKLCLDGERLIQTDSAGNPLQPTTTNDVAGLSGSSYREYRTQADKRWRIRAYGIAGINSPKYFIVRGADGLGPVNTNAIRQRSERS
ncbi:SpvB/TcaC N-terminal domain-containing protein [Roseateles sp.]|uniref:SpvB/TcaC N-terminal domain-containing protein n=1 Tax=Roseateles sp. TaxID=1971397 RepID=UPI0039E77E15